MPLTPLFPAEGELITLEQGPVGDCYLLASLDCILNAGVDRAKFQSMFTEAAEGVTLRIKRTKIGSHLKPKMLEGKYGYTYNEDTKEDVFFISKKRLAEIDSKDSIGVKTNSLAVKILEHISSYYFVKSWNHHEAMGSIKAHTSNGQTRHSVHETSFVGYLLGIKSTQISDINKIIRIKTINPDFPVYISMDWGGMIHGSVHPRHALRIDKIIPPSSASTDYTFSLVNPWDNSKTENYTLTEIKGRNPDFSIFTQNKPIMEFTKLLMELPTEDGALILGIPKLGVFIKKIKAVQLIFSATDAQKALSIYKLMPGIGDLYAKLSKPEQQQFYISLCRANGDKDVFINELLHRVPRSAVARDIVQEGLSQGSTAIIVELCLTQKDKTLYALLNNVDIFTHLIVTDANPNQFLRDIIELELGQAKPNAKRLKLISEYIKIYNKTFPLAQLTPHIEEHQIPLAVLKKEEVDLFEAQCIVLFTIEKIKKYPIAFASLTTHQDVALAKTNHIGEIQQIDAANLITALNKVSTLEKNQLQQTIIDKIFVIKNAANAQLLSLKLAEETIDKYIRLLDFSVTYSVDFTEDHTKKHAFIFAKKVKELASLPELSAACTKLGLKAHPGIDNAVKIKIDQIENLAKKRVQELHAAQREIENSIKNIAEFSPSFAAFGSVAELHLEHTKQLKLLHNLRDASPTLEAHKVLGLQTYHPDLANAVDKKLREITSESQHRITTITEINNKTQGYLSKIKELTINFSKADTELKIRNTTAHLFAKLTVLKEQAQVDPGLTNPAKTTVLEAIIVHERFAREAGITAHNKLAYTKLEAMLENSGFKECYRLFAARADAAKEMTKINPQYVSSAKVAGELNLVLSKARSELLTIPTDTKITTVKIKEKVEEFQKKTLKTMDNAATALNGKLWHDRLTTLTQSIKDLSTLLTETPVLNRHQIFSGTTKSPTSRITPHAAHVQMIVAA